MRSPADGDSAVYQFTCADNGIGMSEEFQQHIFEPFMQESNDARTRYQGTGLGLSIVKRLVEAMGGQITFTSRKDVGTTFCVTLPFEIDRHYAPDPDEEEAKGSSWLEGHPRPAGGGQRAEHGDRRVPAAGPRRLRHPRLERQGRRWTPSPTRRRAPLT